MPGRRVAIVGAGLSGLVCARALVAHGHEVVVFDKGRAPGGRATSRLQDGRVFDHGAQYFTARTEWLARQVSIWEHDGVVARWEPRGRKNSEPWWVGTPSMGALAAHLAQRLDVRLERSVTRVERGLVVVGDREEREHVDDVVVALPAPQAAVLVGELFPIIRGVSLDPCWAVMMVVTAETGPVGLDLVEGEGPIAWAAREPSKPGRDSTAHGDAWTLHMSRDWTVAHLDADPETVSEMATALFVAQHPGARVLLARAHRWRYARAHKAAPVGCFFDEAQRVVVCGDWLDSPRVEGAITSGLAAANALVGG